LTDEPHVMVTLKEIAEREGVSVQAISKAVKAMPDLPVERDTRGRVKTISLAHFEHHRGQYVNPAKTQRKQPAAASDSFDEARRQSEWLKVDRLKLERQEQLGNLVRKDMLVIALERCASEIQARVDRIANVADEGALAVSKEGAHGLRVLLRESAKNMNTDIADILATIADAAPETDSLIEDVDA